ncbi:uncharacterized protein LOC142974708 [Anticarsia gemmatalis]|uniref:uncharacterized protein LOC142974708 n=1 Tax=Anticarsia gemmatalis TaxID=129554 RepID=UPI003F76B116
MSLTDLPVEILIIIVKMLDTVSQRRLYDTCKTLRNLICTPGLIKYCNLSQNVMATISSFKLNFFKHISHDLRVLIICGVPDLFKTTCLPGLRKLKNLKVLDVSYTNLQFMDVIDIHEACPSIKDLTINYGPASSNQYLQRDALLQAQTALGNFENIHFVGSPITLLYCNLPFSVLSKAHLHQLTYTVAQNTNWRYLYETISEICNPVFDQFTVYLLNFRHTSKKPGDINIFAESINVLSQFDLNNYEYVIITIKQFGPPKVIASSMFKDYFQDTFDVTVYEFGLDLIGNVLYMLWKKETKFDENFYVKLTTFLKQYFPHTLQEFPEREDILKNDWFYSVPRPHSSQIHDLRQMSKKRIAVPNYLLNYDETFKDKGKVELTIEFKYPGITVIALLERCTYLRKLTYLSLVGFGRYNYNFFHVLFRSCIQLVTVNLQGLAISPCSLAVSGSLTLSKSVKNIRIVDKGIDFVTLFNTFSKCPTLENIHVMDEAQFQNNGLVDPTTLVEKCSNLYCVYMQAKTTETNERNFRHLFKEAKKKYKRPYINVTFFQPESKQWFHDPFVDVFKLDAIRPCSMYK